MNLCPKAMIQLLKKVIKFDSVGVKVIKGRDMVITIENPRRR